MRLSALLVVLLACGVGGAAPALGANRPDVVIELPGKPFPGQVAPQYVDAFTEPGRLLYRFDATLKNRGGALDLYKRSGGPVMQAIWDGGKPPPGAQPRADTAPQRSAAVKLANRGKLGASMSYVVEPDHSHFHFMRIARYELRVPGRRTPGGRTRGRARSVLCGGPGRAGGGAARAAGRAGARRLGGRLARGRGALAGGGRGGAAARGRARGAGRAGGAAGHRAGAARAAAGRPLGGRGDGQRARRGVRRAPRAARARAGARSPARPS